MSFHQLKLKFCTNRNVMNRYVQHMSRTGDQQDHTEPGVILV